MIFYHIDRTNSLKTGDVINLNKKINLNEECGSYFLNDFFPDGISKHGEHYLHDFIATPMNNIPLQSIREINNEIGIYISELSIELIRRCKYPYLPSRFTSLFCLLSLDDLKQWPELKTSNYSIYEIEYDSNDIYIFDASHIKSSFFHIPCIDGKSTYGFSSSIVYTTIDNYLSQKISQNPKREVLVPLPITIGKKVK